MGRWLIPALVDLTKGFIDSKTSSRIGLGLTVVGGGLPALLPHLIAPHIATALVTAGTALMSRGPGALGGALPKKQIEKDKN